MNLTSWYRDLIGWAAVSGASAAGDPTYGSVQTGIPARVEAEVTVVGHAADGSEIVSNHTIYTNAAISADDKVWMPGLSTSNLALARRVLESKPNEDRNGKVAFYRVRL